MPGIRSLCGTHHVYDRGKAYSFLYRSQYRKEIDEAKDYDTLHGWFIRKLEQCCTNIAAKPKAMTDSAVMKAKTYIDGNYGRDLSLDEVSKRLT